MEDGLGLIKSRSSGCRREKQQVSLVTQAAQSADYGKELSSTQPSSACSPSREMCFCPADRTGRLTQSEMLVKMKVEKISKDLKEKIHLNPYESRCGLQS